jgi:imidazolonepropionase-like amidohydrolase
MDGYLEEVVSDGIRARLDAGESVPLGTLLEAVEGRKTRAMAAHTRSSDTWVVPTLHALETRVSTLDVDALLDRPEMAYVPSFISDEWTLQAGTSGARDPAIAQRMIQVDRRILRSLTMAGVGVLMGTDSPSLFHIPGFSLRLELRSLAAAGLTPYEILVTGTRNVAEYATRELLEPGNFGNVTQGHRADLILLRANPFDDIEALWDQEGIMVRGRWMDRDEMESHLAELRERMGG